MNKDNRDRQITYLIYDYSISLEFCTEFLHMTPESAVKVQVQEVKGQGHSVT